MEPDVLARDLRRNATLVALASLLDLSGAVVMRESRAVRTAVASLPVEQQARHRAAWLSTVRRTQVAAFAAFVVVLAAGLLAEELFDTVVGIAAVSFLPVASTAATIALWRGAGRPHPTR